MYLNSSSSSSSSFKTAKRSCKNFFRGTYGRGPAGIQFTADENRLFQQRLLHNLQATFNLIANFISETRDFISENRERKCCGCHCVKKRVTVSPKSCYEKLNTISIGDLRDGAVGVFGDGIFEKIGDDAVGDFRDGMVGDFGDGIVGYIRDGAVRDGIVREIMDGAFASGNSSSAGNSGNMEQLGE